MILPVPQPHEGPIHGDHYLPSTPATVSWGWLPTAASAPVLTVNSGETVTIDTVSHEGILEDQGRDPRSFFAALGLPSSYILHDAVAISAAVTHDPEHDGPHIVTGPIAVRGAAVGDVIAI